MNYKVAVIGLGYVGLPLAVSLSESFHVIGYDINQERVSELSSGFDVTGELTENMLSKTLIKFTNDAKKIADCSIYIVTVPTPVTSFKSPDMSF